MWRRLMYAEALRGRRRTESPSLRHGLESEGKEGETTVLFIVLSRNKLR